MEYKVKKNSDIFRMYRHLLQGKPVRWKTRTMFAGWTTITCIEDLPFDTYKDDTLDKLIFEIIEE